MASCKKSDYAEIVGEADIWIRNATDQPLRDVSIRTRGYYGDGSMNTDSTGFSLVSPRDSIQLSIRLKLRSQGDLLLKARTSEKEMQAYFADFSGSSTYNPKSKVTVFKDTIIVENPSDSYVKFLFYKCLYVKLNEDSTVAWDLQEPFPLRCIA